MDYQLCKHERLRDECLLCAAEPIQRCPGCRCSIIRDMDDVTEVDGDEWHTDCVPS